MCEVRRCRRYYVYLPIWLLLLYKADTLPHHPRVHETLRDRGHMFTAVLTVALCDALMLAVLVYGLAVAKATTNSYHLDLIALAALCPAIFVALMRDGHLAAPFAFLLSIAITVLFKMGSTYVASNPSRRTQVSTTTLTIVSFALFQATMVIYGLTLSNKSVSVNLDKDNVHFLSSWIALPKDKAASILIGFSLVVALLLLDKLSKSIVLLRALKENADLLVQFDYSIVPIFWRGTVLAALLASLSGFLILLQRGVGPPTAYNLFFLSFSVLLLVESLSILRILLIALIVSVLYYGVLAVTDASHQPITGSIILLFACGIRYFAPAR